MKFFILLILISFSFEVFSNERVTVSYNFFTSHTDTSFENDDGDEVRYNNNNDLVGLAYQYDENSSVGVGYMPKNSYYEKSYLVAWDNWVRLGSYVDTGIDLFLATGYQKVTGKNSSGRMFGALPYFRIRPFESDVVSFKIGRINLFMGTVGVIEFNFDL